MAVEVGRGLAVSTQGELKLLLLDWEVSRQHLSSESVTLACFFSTIWEVNFFLIS